MNELFNALDVELLGHDQGVELLLMDGDEALALLVVRDLVQDEHEVPVRILRGYWELNNSGRYFDYSLLWMEILG